MSNVININYPEELANSLRLNEKDFEEEIKMSSLAKLFELGRVSSGIASKVLGVSRIEFLEKLVDYKVSIWTITDFSDLEEDIANA